MGRSLSNHDSGMIEFHSGGHAFDPRQLHQSNQALFGFRTASGALSELSSTADVATIQPSSNPELVEPDRASQSERAVADAALTEHARVVSEANEDDIDGLAPAIRFAANSRAARSTPTDR